MGGLASTRIDLQSKLMAQIGAVLVGDVVGRSQPRVGPTQMQELLLLMPLTRSGMRGGILVVIMLASGSFQ